METVIVCAGCGKPFRVPQQHLGRKFRCAACGTVTVAGASEELALWVGPPSASAPDVPPTAAADEVHEPTLLTRLSRGLHAFWGLTYWGLFVVLAPLCALLDFSITQLVMFSCALGLIPGAHKVRFLRRLVDDIDDMRDFYRRHPFYISPFGLLCRMVPVLGALMMLREWSVMIRVMLISLPLDLALEVLTTYVIPLPDPANVLFFAKDMSFGWRVFWQCALTVVATPYMVWIVIFLRGIKQREDQSSDRPARVLGFGLLLLLASAVFAVSSKWTSLDNAATVGLVLFAGAAFVVLGFVWLLGSGLLRMLRRD